MSRRYAISLPRDAVASTRRDAVADRVGPADQEGEAWIARPGTVQSGVMLYYLVAAVYVLACLLLLLVVLLQQGKGGDIASAFGGGGSQTAFGARAGATVLTKASAILGAIFMIGAIVLGIMGRGGAGSLLQGIDAPAQQTQPAAPAPQPQNQPAPQQPEKAPEQPEKK
jgi:preprotein translocase subunit SecG